MTFSSCQPKKVNLIVTDGAPAMAGKIRSLLREMKDVAPKTDPLQHLIHQIVPCA